MSAPEPFVATFGAGSSRVSSSAGSGGTMLPTSSFSGGTDHRTSAARRRARLLGIGVRRLRDLTREGIVPAQKVKSGHIYSRDELLSLRDDIGRHRGRVRASKSHSVPKIRSYSRSSLSGDAIEP